ncbi:hypothetical protein [Loktanella sp. R86503]|uniref:hypothetical protein n=1 Tax=Loktanella sp. R86503 TaxID=3093847 RepID=UPI0036DE7306
MTGAPAYYLIYKAGRGYYRPAAQGYTTSADDAGLFSFEDAWSYSHPNGEDGPRDGISFMHQSEVETGSSCVKDIRIHALESERDQLAETQSDLSHHLSDALDRIATLEAQLSGANAAADFISHTITDGRVTACDTIIHD